MPRKSSPSSSSSYPPATGAKSSRRPRERLEVGRSSGSGRRLRPPLLLPLLLLLPLPLPRRRDERPRPPLSDPSPPELVPVWAPVLVPVRGPVLAPERAGLVPASSRRSPPRRRRRPRASPSAARPVSLRLSPPLPAVPWEPPAVPWEPPAAPWEPPAAPWEPPSSPLRKPSARGVVGRP